MPIYEYECQSCKNRTELMQKLSDPPLETCESCGGSLQKILSAPGIMFKGSGWYVTDYSDKMKNPKKGEKKEGGKGEKGEPAKKTEPVKSEKKTESKGEAKTPKPAGKEPSSK